MHFSSVNTHFFPSATSSSLSLFLTSNSITLSLISSALWHSTCMNSSTPTFALSYLLLGTICKGFTSFLALSYTFFSNYGYWHFFFCSGLKVCLVLLFTIWMSSLIPHLLYESSSSILLTICCVLTLNYLPH